MILRRRLLFAAAVIGGCTSDLPPPIAQFVLSDLKVLPPVQGMDLDGDGTIDNAIGVLGISEQGVNSLLRSSVQDGRFLLLVELAGLSSDVDDPTIDLHFYQGKDTDGDASNNLS